MTAALFTGFVMGFGFALGTAAFSVAARTACAFWKRLTA